MKKKPSRFKHRVEYAFLYIIYLMVNILPYRCTHAIAAQIAGLGFYVLRLRRRETVERIMKALDIPKKEAVKIAAKAYFNITAASLEFIRFRKIRKVFDAGYIRVEGLEYVQQLQKEGKGAVLAAMHSGSWEISGAALTFHDIPMFYVTGIQHNPYVDKLINDMRRSIGVGLIPKKGVLKHVFRRLKAGEFLGIVADQYIAGDSIPVTFFNQEVSSPKGPAAFAIKTKVPVIPFITVRESRWKHLVMLKEPIMPDPKAEREAEIIRITQAYTDVFEQVIREHPGDWFWLHRRFRKKD